MNEIKVINPYDRIREINNELSILEKEEIALKRLSKRLGGDRLREFWDNPEDDRWDKEYNPDLLPETLKNKEEKQDE